MIIMKDRIEIPEIQEVKSRFDPTPEPYTLHIREQFNDDGTVTTIHRKRIYSGVVSGCVIVDEPI